MVIQNQGHGSVNPFHREIDEKPKPKVPLF